MQRKFDKKLFKSSVINNVKNLFRKTIDEATPMQMFQAVSYAVKDIIIDEWIATHKEYEKQDAKTVYYLSMEFLMGRALGNNIINIGAREEIKEALDEMGIDLNVLEDQEPDAALGNGGLKLLDSRTHGRLNHPVAQILGFIYLHALDSGFDVRQNCSPPCLLLNK